MDAISFTMLPDFCKGKEDIQVNMQDNSHSTLKSAQYACYDVYLVF